MDNDFLKIKESSIHGKGVFTEKGIPAGHIFYIIPVEKIFSQPIKRCAKIKDNAWVYDEAVLNFINHSCEPNTELDVSKEHPFLIAIKDIRSGDEITVNYDLTEIEGGKIFCECKKLTCKKYFLRVD